MKKHTFLILLLVFTACDPINKLYVKYGEAKPMLEKPGGVIRLFFDRNGTLYPDLKIPDEGLEKSGGSLNQLYQNRPALYHNVLAAHHLPAAASISQLQQQLVNQAIAKINEAATGRRLVFLVHGYNNHPLLPEADNSFAVYQLLEEKIRARYPARAIQFVEIYWDGCSKMNGKLKPVRMKLNSIKIWDNAQAASNNVAVELRRILAGLENDDNIIITHSLGASVATCALFNVRKFKNNEFMRGIIAKYNDEKLYSTPVKKFRVGMLAPAIPGTNTFDEFNDRTPNDGATNNYRFIVGLNTNDEVLRKFVGIPKWFGSTSLGCVQDELDAVEKMVNINGRHFIDHTTFSSFENGKSQTDHSLITYLGNTKPLDEFLDLLFKQD